MRVAGMNVDWTEVELRVIQREIDSRGITDPDRLEARRSYPEFQAEQQAEFGSTSAAGNNNNDVKQEIKDEADVKTEIDDRPTIGVINTVKSEPMSDNTTNSSSNDSTDVSSSDLSSDSDVNESSYNDWPFSPAGSTDSDSDSNDSDSDSDSDDSDSNTDYTTSDDDNDEEQNQLEETQPLIRFL